MGLPQAIEQIRPSIVQFCFMAIELSEKLRQQVGAPFLKKVIGTGFFVNDDGCVITARHVLQGGMQLVSRVDAGRKNMVVGLGLPNSENFIGNTVLVDFDLVDENENHDLALIKLRRNPFRGEVRSGVRIGANDVPVLTGVVRLNPDRPLEGQSVGVSGYPFDKSVLVTNSGCLASIWTTPNYLADVEVNPGNSGGPVYLIDDTSVIGVCVATEGSPVWHDRGEAAQILGHTLYSSSGLTHVIPTKFVTEILEKNKLSFTTTASR
jgi:S1-C subfamily serine protease